VKISLGVYDHLFISLHLTPHPLLIKIYALQYLLNSSFIYYSPSNLFFIEFIAKV